MHEPRALVLRTAGTNCDAEAVHACRLVGCDVDLVHIRQILDDPSRLETYHLLLIPGGFSYGDDLGGGRILANEIRYRLREATEKFIADGKLVLGICNGFQVLVKAGLLPGRDGDDEPTVTLTHNDSNRFEDRWVHLEVVSDRCAFVEKGERMYLPVAHAEGKFVTRDDALLGELESAGQIVFRYVDAQGGPASYPDNPNGSVGNVAGITDPTGRILGLMPHPERHVTAYQHPTWTRRRGPLNALGDGDGLAMFRRASELARSELV